MAGGQYSDSAFASDARLRELMRQGQAGDAAAYRTVLSEVARRARAYFRRRLNDEDAAEDFAQEVLLSVHKSRHTYDASRSFGAWCAAILQRRYVDAVRSMVRSLGPGRADVPVENLPAQAAAEGDERLKWLMAALEQLPPQQAMAIRLTQLEGCSGREAALRLGQSEVALRVSVHRGKRALFRLLRDRGQVAGNEDD